jgi:hypothetical protein
LDWLIDGKYAWAIEALRQGDRIEEHEQRFLTGAYSSPLIKHFRMVDFQVSSGHAVAQKRKFAGYLKVSFEPDFSSMTVTLPLGDVVKLSTRP